jgi:hypothetical protein
MITSFKQRRFKVPKKLKYTDSTGSNKYDNMNKQLKKMSLGSSLSSTANVDKVSDDNCSYIDEEVDSDNDSYLPDAPDVPIPEDEDEFMWNSLCERKRMNEKQIYMFN